jgi:hypothetical protein
MAGELHSGVLVLKERLLDDGAAIVLDSKRYMN